MTDADKIKIKILIVDDHPVTLTMLRKILKQLGFEDVVEANDGDVALEMANKEKPALIFTDLNMPVLSGIELIQRLRENEKMKELPVIVVSGEAEYEMVKKAIKAGADNFIVKPFSPKIIREKIMQVLSKRGLHIPIPE